MRCINVEEMDFIAGGYEYGGDWEYYESLNDAPVYSDYTSNYDVVIQAMVDMNNQWLADNPVEIDFVAYYDALAQAAIDANNAWLAANPIESMDAYNSYVAARALDPDSHSQDLSCWNGMLGGGIAGSLGGVVGIALGVIGGGVAGGCLNPAIEPDGQ